MTHFGEYSTVIWEGKLKILIEHVKEEEMRSMEEWLNGFSWRVLPPEIILYQPCFDLENPPYEGQEE